MAQPIQDPLWWVHRLSQRLMIRQAKYKKNEDYDIGNHALPNGDPRFFKALKQIQDKAETNYIGLANKAVTDRMRIKGFRFGDERELDQEARKFWDYNNMSLQAGIAIRWAARLSDVYALVSPPKEPGSPPVITIEDPRICIVEPDPVDPLRSLAGLKFYEDSLSGVVVAVLYMSERIYTYEGSSRRDFLERDVNLSSQQVVAGNSAWRLVSVLENTLGQVPLFRGNWQPEFGMVGMAECENGGYEIQDRINYTTLARMVITGNQAYRQRWVAGAEPPPQGKGKAVRPPWNPGADTVWALADPAAKFGDFEQADIRQLLEAVRDDIGDFAAITQTPVTYLTNKMVNVSADTMTAAQVSLVSKVRNRMDSMGWFFEQVIKCCFAYSGNSKAEEIAASTVWYDPEARSLAEVADMVSKLTASNVPLEVSLEIMGLDEDVIKFAVEEAKKAAEEQAKQAQDLAKASAANKPAASSAASKPRPKK